MVETEAGTVIDIQSAAGKALYADVLRIDNEMRSHMSPRGALGLPELVDKRRLEYGIPDGAFESQPLYERIFVYQIDRVTGDTFENSKLVRPDITKARDREEAPLGVLISAGLGALDIMASHGLQLGDVVNFLKLTPLRIQCDTVDGQPRYVLVLKVGDLAAGKDLRTKLRSGELQVKQHVTHESGQAVYTHCLADAKGYPVRPQDPFQPADY